MRCSAERIATLGLDPVFSSGLVSHFFRRLVEQAVELVADAGAPQPRQLLQERVVVKE